MRSCDRDVKGFARSKDTSLRSLSLLYAIPDGRPPGFTIVLIRQTNPTSLPPTASSKSTLNYQAGHKRNWIGLGLDRRRGALENFEEGLPVAARGEREGRREGATL